MAGGQAIDLEAVGRELGAADIEQMHALKTGALLRASVTLAATLVPDLPQWQRTALDRYAAALHALFDLDPTAVTALTENPGGSPRA